MSSKRVTVGGGGPGGYTTAFSAARAGAEVTLVESGAFGGTCLNAGCIPTKALKASADVREVTGRLEEFGLKGTRAEVDMSAVQARKERGMAMLRGGLENTCASLNIRMVHGRGRLSDAGGVVATSPGAVKRMWPATLSY